MTPIVIRVNEAEAKSREPTRFPELNRVLELLVDGAKDCLW